MQAVEMRQQDLFQYIETKPLALVILAGMAKPSEPARRLIFTVIG